METHLFLRSEIVQLFDSDSDSELATREDRHRIEDGDTLRQQHELHVCQIVQKKDKITRRCSPSRSRFWRKSEWCYMRTHYT